MRIMRVATVEWGMVGSGSSRVEGGDLGGAGGAGNLEIVKPESAKAGLVYSKLTFWKRRKTSGAGSQPRTCGSMR